MTARYDAEDKLSQAFEIFFRGNKNESELDVKRKFSSTRIKCFIKISTVEKCYFLSH